MDNNIDNKGYWENQTIAQKNKVVNDSELIALLKQEFDNINKTLEVIRDGVNDIKDYAKTRDINKLNDSSLEVSKQEETPIAEPEIAKSPVENEENILPIGDILQVPVEEKSETKVEDENIVPIDLPVIDNNEGLDVTEQVSTINPDSLIVNENQNLGEQVAPVVEETPVIPVAESLVQTEVPTVAETVAPEVNETPIMPVAETPVQTEVPTVAAPVAPVTENIDTVEVIPLTFDSAKIAPIDPSLKSAQRTEILTENQNAILKGKSVSNTNVMSLQPSVPELVKAA